MTLEKIQSSIAAIPTEYPIELKRAAELLVDRNGLTRLLRGGDYRPIGNRIAFFINAFQEFRRVDILSGEDRKQVVVGIKSILDLPGYKQSEKPYLLETIKEQFEKYKVSPEYLESF